MAIIVNNIKPYHIMYNGVEATLYHNGIKIWPEDSSTYKMKLLFRDNVTPTFSYGTGTQITQSPNVWELKYNNKNWDQLLYNQRDLLEVIECDSRGVSSMYGTFTNCMALTSVSLFDTSEVVDMTYMFEYCSSLSSVPTYDTSKVRNLDYTFRYCYNLQEIPNLNTSAVSSMSSTFVACSAITTIPQLDISNVRSLSYTFARCESLEYVPPLNTSAVTHMDDTFMDCFKLTAVSPLDLRSTTDTRGMFNACTSLSSAPTLNNMQGVRTARGMFTLCSSLQYVPLYDTTNMVDVGDMFADCYAVTGGALALYNQMTAQANPPTAHNSTFFRCGTATQQGRAELAQIPSNWGGLAT